MEYPTQLKSDGDGIVGLKVKIKLTNLSQTYELKATEVKYSLMLDVETAMVVTGVEHLAALAPTITISVKGFVSGTAKADMKDLKDAAENWWKQSVDPTKYYGEFWWHEGSGSYTPSLSNPNIGGGVWNQVFIQRLNFNWVEGSNDSSGNSPGEIEYTMDLVGKY